MESTWDLHGVLVIFLYMRHDTKHQVCFKISTRHHVYFHSFPLSLFHFKKMNGLVNACKMSATMLS